MEEGIVLFYLLSYIFWGGFLFLFFQKPNGYLMIILPTTYSCGTFSSWSYVTFMI